MNENLYQLVYMSTATQNFSENPNEIDVILQSSLKNNPSSNVTGMLLFRGGIFLQLLEGSEKDVINTYGRVAMDKRHKDLKILVRQAAGERLFKDWTMAYKVIDTPDLEMINTILPWNDLIKESQEGHLIPNTKIMEILKAFRLQVNKK